MNKVDKRYWNELKVLAEKGDLLIENCLFTIDPFKLFVKGTIGDQIQDVTKSRWTHIGMYKGHQEFFEATYPRVKKTKLDDLAPRWYHKYEVALIRLNGITIDDIQAIMSFWWKIVGSKYDFPQLAGIKVNAEFEHLDYPTALNDPNKFVCIEAVYKSLKYAGIKDIDLVGINSDNYFPNWAVKLIEAGRAKLMYHFIPMGYHGKLQHGKLEE